MIDNIFLGILDHIYMMYCSILYQENSISICRSSTNKLSYWTSTSKDNIFIYIHMHMISNWNIEYLCIEAI